MIDFKLDRSGVSSLLKENNQLETLQQSALEGLLPIIEASFFQTFGLKGKFEIVSFTTDRSSVKISAADKQTNAVLKASPKWLDQFIDNIII